MAETTDPTWCPANPLGRNPYLTGEQRADIARWVVAMRRAHDASTEQTTGHLRDSDGHCCLGLWCDVATERGVLEFRVLDEPLGRFEYRAKEKETGVDQSWQSGALPFGASLAGADDPEVMCFANREIVGDDPDDLAEAVDNDTEWETITAAALNDDHGLNFGQIADVVAWSFAVTAEELATAELAPRVVAIEGEAPESSQVTPPADA